MDKMSSGQKIGLLSLAALIVYETLKGSNTGQGAGGILSGNSGAGAGGVGAGNFSGNSLNFSDLLGGGSGSSNAFDPSANYFPPGYGQSSPGGYLTNLDNNQPTAQQILLPGQQTLL